MVTDYTETWKTLSANKSGVKIFPPHGIRRIVRHEWEMIHRLPAECVAQQPTNNQCRDYSDLQKCLRRGFRSIQ